MNITQALTLAAKVKSLSGLIPILDCVLVDASGLSVTDMEVHLSIRVPVPGWEGAARPLHCKTLLSAVKAAGGNLHAIGPHAVALTTGATIAVPTLETADFPSFNKGPLPIAFTMPAATLSLMLHRTAHAESTEETRYYLNGTYLHARTHMEEVTLRAVATDGKRMAVATAPLPGGAGGLPGIIIPRRTTKLLRDVLGKRPEGDVSVKASDTRIQISYGSVTLTSKLIDGIFPEYERVIPSDPTPRMTVPAAELRAAIKTVTVGAERYAPVVLGGREVRCGANRATLATADIVGGAHETGFSSDQILSMLEHMGLEVLFSQTDPREPAVFSDPGDPSWFEVIMPVTR